MDHPHVYWLDDQAQPVTITLGEPELHVTRGAERVHLRLDPVVRGESDVIVERDGPYRVRAVRTTALHRRVGKLLGKGLTVPPMARPRLRAIIDAVSDRIPVHSDLGVDVADARSVASEPRPVVQLSRLGDGLQVRLCVRPLGDGGPTARPGIGAASMVADLDGERLATERDLADEAARAEALIEACHSLRGAPVSAGEWCVEDATAALALVGELDGRDDGTRVEWLDSRPLRLLPEVSAAGLQLKIARARGGDAFVVSGSLALGDEHAPALGSLIELLADSPEGYLRLDPNTFVPLAAGFRQRLEALRRIAADVRGELVLPRWASDPIEALVEEALVVKACRAWRAHLKALREASEAPCVVPSTLKATLRDYQEEGYRWLARLAHLGVGACLADDMGLGKTVQALALLLDRAAAGPALVVCPTSVIGGWLDEARRFAPALRVRRFGTGDREAALAAAGPFDVLVTSYGVMQAEHERLAGRTWATVVLDEAQAIKNPGTRRAKAACDLKAGFRLALTGTPIENRLDELWSLFRFLIPGLLGSRKQFGRRFADPIERRRDPAARGALRRLVHPFLLRRTKAAVLDELPPRTDIVVHVELGPEEASLYETLRLSALETLAKEAATDGRRHLRVLAEITRLRQACCNSRLVLSDGEKAPESAKLAAFGEKVELLLAAGHKALVFSQFVGHLALVREWLDGRGIHYQYLDGQTPEAVRRARVAAFQAGQGELFLVSLRAGGTGLNLTVADHVIHLDPWWNPAVEDQASDRTHRIGQDRPVTVLRLVTRGAIEDKVMALHHAKRELAFRLLEGADHIVPLDADALLALLG